MFTGTNLKENVTTMKSAHNLPWRKTGTVLRRLLPLLLCLLLLWCLAFHVGVKAGRLAGLYDLPDAALAERLGEHTVLSARNSLLDSGEAFQGRFRCLSGAMPGGELTLDSSCDYCVEVQTRFGCGGLLLIRDDGTMLRPESGEAFALPAGSWRLYYLGDVFWGSVRLTKI